MFIGWRIDRRAVRAVSHVWAKTICDCLSTVLSNRRAMKAGKNRWTSIRAENFGFYFSFKPKTFLENSLLAERTVPRWRPGTGNLLCDNNLLILLFKWCIILQKRKITWFIQQDQSKLAWISVDSLCQLTSIFYRSLGCQTPKWLSESQPKWNKTLSQALMWADSHDFKGMAPSRDSIVGSFITCICGAKTRSQRLNDIAIFLKLNHRRLFPSVSRWVYLFAELWDILTAL